MSFIRLDDFLKSLKEFIILDSGKNIKPYEAIQVLIEKPEYNIVTYNHYEQIQITPNILKIDTESGKYYYEYVFTRDCDIIKDISIIGSSFDSVLIVGGVSYNVNDIKVYSICSAMYSPFSLKIFPKEQLTQTININFLKSILNNEEREKIFYGYVEDENFYYNGGVAISKKKKTNLQ